MVMILMYSMKIRFFKFGFLLMGEKYLEKNQGEELKSRIKRKLIMQENIRLQPQKTLRLVKY